MKRIQLLGLALCLSTVACDPKAGQTAEIEHVKPGEAKQLIEQRGAKDLTIIDVRTAQEHRAGHIPQTDANVDWYKWSQAFSQLPQKPDKTRPVLVYCRSGGRSNAAAEWFVNHGYSNVYNLVGGYTAWTEAGFEQE